MSVLQFLNGCVTGSKVPQIKGPANQPIVPIMTERNVSLTWRAIQDSDQGEDGDREDDIDRGEDVFLSKRGQPHMRTTGDIRVLYEMRPAGGSDLTMNTLVLSQHITVNWRKKKKLSVKVVTTI